MRKIPERWSIPIATLFSVALIVGAYLLAHGAASPSVAQASTETALLQAIATKDSTGDGVPDWEKALYGIPLNATTTDYFHLGMTDGEAVARGLIVPKAIANIPAAPAATSTAVSPSDFDYAAYGLPPPSPGTLTDAFSQTFFTLYLQAKQANGGAELSADQVNTLASQAIADLSASVSATPPYEQAGDIKVAGKGPDALHAYAAEAEAIFQAHPADATTSEIDYLQDYLENSDSSALKHIASIASSDRAIAAGLAVISAPEELRSAHLALVNALMHMSEVINDFSHADTDPITAMLALSQYEQASQDLGAAFVSLGQEYEAEGVTFSPGEKGATLVGLATKLVSVAESGQNAPVSSVQVSP